MKANLKNILVPVDFNPSSLNSVSYACDIARKIDGKIHLVYVIETRGPINDFLQSGNEIVKITDQVKSRLGEIAEKYAEEYKVKIETRVERGRVYKKILDASEELDARFIVLGENHPFTSEDQTLGSTVFQVTLKSPAPVITVKGDYKQLGSNFVVPLDLTKQTRKQVLATIVYGMHYGAKMNLVSVKIADLKMRSSLILKKIRKAHKTLVDNNVDADYKLYEYSKDVTPYKRVLEYAEEIGADMIMLLTHSEGFTYDNYIGAFAHHIINESPVPVLSLTSSAASISVEDFIKPILDPVGYLFKDAY